MAHSMCSLVHKLISRLVLEGLKKNPVPNMSSSIHHLRSISSWSHRLIEHRPSHLTNGTIFPLNYTILPCLHGAHTKSIWYFNFGNPRTKPSKLKHDNKSKHK
jgi:hypothetical protein